MTDIDERHPCFGCVSITGTVCTNKLSSYFKMDLTRRIIRNCRQKDYRKELQKIAVTPVEPHVDEMASELEATFIEDDRSEVVAAVNSDNPAVIFYTEGPCKKTGLVSCHNCPVPTNECPDVAQKNEEVFDTLLGRPVKPFIPAKEIIDLTIPEPDTSKETFEGEVFDVDENGKVTSLRVKLIFVGDEENKVDNPEPDPNYFGDLIPEKLIIKNYRVFNDYAFVTKEQMARMFGDDGDAIVIRPIFEEKWYYSHELETPLSITGADLQKLCMKHYGREADGIINKIYGSHEREELKEELLESAEEQNPGLLDQVKQVEEISARVKEIEEHVRGYKAQEIIIDEAADTALDDEDCEKCLALNGKEAIEKMKEMSHYPEVIDEPDVTPLISVIETSQTPSSVENSETETRNASDLITSSLTANQNEDGIYNNINDEVEIQPEVEETEEAVVPDDKEETTHIFKPVLPGEFVTVKEMEYSNGFELKTREQVLDEEIEELKNKLIATEASRDTYWERLKIARQEAIASVNKVKNLEEVNASMEVLIEEARKKVDDMYHALDKKNEDISDLTGQLKETLDHNKLLMQMCDDLKKEAEERVGLVDVLEKRCANLKNLLDVTNSDWVGSLETNKKLREQHEVEIAAKDSAIKSLEDAADQWLKNNGKVKKQEDANKELTGTPNREVPNGKTPEEIIQLRRAVDRINE